SSDSVPAKPSSSIAAAFPLRDDYARLTSAASVSDLRQALRCDLIAVTSRTLSQSARITRPFGLLSARSITGPPCALQSLFPARLQLAFGFRLRLRQPGCNLKSLTALAHGSSSPNTVLIPSACRIFR